MLALKSPSQREVYAQKAYFSQMLCTNVFTSLLVFLLCQDNPSTGQVWHIKKLMKQHDHYTGALCAGDNKRPLKCAVLSQLACRLQERPPLLLPENVNFTASNLVFRRIWQYVQPASQPQTTCNDTSPGPPDPVSSPAGLSEISHPDS